MSDDDSEPRLRLALSPREAQIVASALRQYEPFWSPRDADSGVKLSEVAADIRRLLNELQAGAAQ